ncbi:tetratricopeptide repeat protein [Jiella pelagia]|uniref:Tetratricopeptide repeat protein n=1 Tax=Jiella pelagia TaxID=2986949 RepID=A0ABY7C2C9_9HYPH|nr:tetratricopeptide repeat protein [Jiella pelagia]WAP69896.1 tetratricopeptide repeat protein [Jiella pelagia]
MRDRGEGKSALASHYIATLGDREDRYRFWDWRDCKEQGDRIRTQITEIIVRFSVDRISAGDLSGVGDAELIEVLLELIRNSNAVLVFDNVDSYVDLENKTLTGMLDMLVQRMSISMSNSRILLTCRPDVHYAASSVITFSMKGISPDEAIELFAKRAPAQSIPKEDILGAHRLTKGHAFWLDLIAVQATKIPGVTLPKLLQDMRRGREDVPDVLSSIWDKLALREKTLLRFMGEAVRPETEETIERFVASHLNYKNFSRALRSLTSLNLIVVKPETDAPDLYDLHPLVRQFVRTKFPQPERAGYIRVVINQYEAIIGAIGSVLGAHLPFAMLERWSQKAELEVSAGLFAEAFATLAKVEDAFIGGGHVQEFVRVGRLLFESIDWETAATRYAEFDNIVGVMIAALDQLGEYDSADALLVRYEATIPQKTARYIKFCDVRAHSYWMRGQFDAAVEWATKGVTLKNETNVDTPFDCAHTLALAQRDSGQPEVALEAFLKGTDLSELTGPKNNSLSDGALFGNVGRCLHLLGRLPEALICYRRSMRLLERESSPHSNSNRAYARRWVGQVFAELGEFREAEAFFLDAIKVLGPSAPVRVREIYAELQRLGGMTAPVMEEVRAMRVVSNWMNS